jgi:hypothetical protein
MRRSVLSTGFAATVAGEELAVELEVVRRRNERQLEEALVAEAKRPGWARKLMPLGAHDHASDGAGQGRRHGIADLAETMPLGDVEPKPVGERMEPGRLPHGDDSVVEVVDWPSRGEAAVVPAGSSA